MCAGDHQRVAAGEKLLVQQGGELAYLIRHDPEFRGVRREHLLETGRRVRLKAAIPALAPMLSARPLSSVKMDFSRFW